ncbi:hypothetical protein [Candidatus Tisiphia endosymbiont of Thecophora atra]
MQTFRDSLYTAKDKNISNYRENIRQLGYYLSSCLIITYCQIKS